MTWRGTGHTCNFMTKRNQLVLSENEQIVLFVQHHWSSLLPSCLTFCVCCVLLNLGSLPEIIDDLLFYAAIIMAVVIIRTVIYIHNEAIIITNKNLYIQYGLFNVNVLKVEYSQVELIDIVHRGIESLFGCGTIHITPQSNIPNINMGYVKNPEMVYNVYQNARKSFLQDKIRQMKELSDEGIISQTEYEFEKMQIMSQSLFNGRPSTASVNVSVEQRQSNGVGTAGFVLSLISLIFSWLPGVNFLVWFIGFILSFIGIFRKPKGLAITGLLISCIDLIILIFVAGTALTLFGLLK